MFLGRGIPGIDVETGSLFADRLVSWRLVAYPSVGKRESGQAGNYHFDNSSFRLLHK